MLCCIECGEVFHSFCVDVPLSTMTDSRRLLWRCHNCKICEVDSCGSGFESEGNYVIYREMYDRVYHILCVTPQLRSPIGIGSVVAVLVVWISCHLGIWKSEVVIYREGLGIIDDSVHQM